MCKPPDKQLFENLNIQIEEALVEWSDIPERRLYRAAIEIAVNDALDPRAYVSERELRGKTAEQKTAMKEKARERMRRKAWDWIFKKDEEADFFTVCEYAYEDGEEMASQIRAYVKQKAASGDFVRFGSRGAGRKKSCIAVS